MLRWLCCVEVVMLFCGGCVVLRCLCCVEVVVLCCDLLRFVVVCYGGCGVRWLRCVVVLVIDGCVVEWLWLLWYVVVVAEVVVMC